MSESRGPASPPPERKPAPYEPPRLVRLADLKDLAAKTGNRFDNPQPHQPRP